MNPSYEQLATYFSDTASGGVRAVLEAHEHMEDISPPPFVQDVLDAANIPDELLPVIGVLVESFLHTIAYGIEEHSRGVHYLAQPRPPSTSL